MGKVPISKEKQDPVVTVQHNFFVMKFFPVVISFKTKTISIVIFLLTNLWIHESTDNFKFAAERLFENEKILT